MWLQRPFVRLRIFSSICAGVAFFNPIILSGLKTSSSNKLVPHDIILFDAHLQTQFDFNRIGWVIRQEQVGEFAVAHRFRIVNDITCRRSCQAVRTYSRLLNNPHGGLFRGTTSRHLRSRKHCGISTNRGSHTLQNARNFRHRETRYGGIQFVVRNIFISAFLEEFCRASVSSQNDISRRPGEFVIP
jgi:hypothetical protein